MIKILDVQKIVNRSPILMATSQYTMASVSCDGISHSAVELVCSFQRTSVRNRAGQDGHTYGSCGYKCAARCIPGAVLHLQYLEPPDVEFGEGTG